MKKIYGGDKLQLWQKKNERNKQILLLKLRKLTIWLEGNVWKKKKRLEGNLIFNREKNSRSTAL